MAKQTLVASNHLYQSQWWARLAAISEKRDTQTSADTPPVQKEQSNFSRTLASLFSPDQGSELISIFVKPN
ncbi:MAG TPA: hypothetical protein VEW46_12920 [Pyrinomonadaceae bacterium]|nr:hypothetical protein [Pyrinomonadaceae bacterium]